MLTCKLCKSQIKNGDEYAKDDGNIICMDCLGNWVMNRYYICEIADALGIDIQEYEEPEDEEPEDEETPEPPIPGQMDMFGNIAT